MAYYMPYITGWYHPLSAANNQGFDHMLTYKSLVFFFQVIFFQGFYYYVVNHHEFHQHLGNPNQANLSKEQ